MSDMDDLIRGARGSRALARDAAGMDAAIRAASGHGPPASQHGEGNSAASAEQLQAARLAQLPDRFAHRLRGDDLTADARAMAGAVQNLGGELVPSTGFDGGARGQQERSGGASMDDQIRRALGNRSMFGGVLPSDDLSHLHTDR